jgi:hypothetical protein
MQERGLETFWDMPRWDPGYAQAMFKPACRSTDDLNRLFPSKKWWNLKLAIPFEILGPTGMLLVLCCFVEI